MRLLLVEDDRPLADGLGAALRQSGYSIDWFADGGEAAAALRSQEYDAVILDLNLPGMSGFEVLRGMRARGQSIPVLILSARDASLDRVKGLDLGADDYLTKPFDLPELEARLRALIRRSGGHADSIMEIGGLRLDAVSRRAENEGRFLELTGREYGMLEILMRRAGHVVSKQFFSERLSEWGSELSDSAIEVQIHRLRKKIEGSGVVIRTLRGFGYLLEADGGS